MVLGIALVAALAMVPMLDPVVWFKRLVRSERGAWHVVWAWSVVPLPRNKFLPWYRVPDWGTGIYKL